MLRTIALLLVFALLAAASEAVLRPTEAGQVEVANRLRTSPKRLLRAASTIIDDEERAIIPVGEQTLLKFSKIVGKKGMQTLAKRLEGKAWEVGKKADHKAWLKAGASPQSKFLEYKWKDKTYEELLQDPNYIRYLGFDELWMKAQHKKGTIQTAEAYLKKVQEDAKKKAAG
ncbi:hypothetical protein PHYSODRAFT_286360 [Phytophthora sojae]|uniref:RxLR effector protein n=2 Tax=Phytophthora sojae TaxID=67593 RepID=G4ZN92_PHYSP|nr:hypothetical protein PHYSODRAFT_286360 [Phytophthora sojae]AEK81088.1 Avh272 [Phytophthora sojae]AEK81089.1 Avh272 [Phytophthora sojae]AEK81090.1 Avh272 [Phytophthora sojae]EGZ15702.1 hypothetical protein PHYSODRAFT_286360 [Phytophthora sojae]|eukprot:XP_009529451.1 hypothetical protein PHYSODRAFT_286360 [Phytophthora sojae]